MGNKNCKVSVRLTPWQEQVLHELAESLDVGYSLLVRTIVGSWLATNEETLYRIIDKNRMYGKSMETNTENTLFGE